MKRQHFIAMDRLSHCLRVYAAKAIWNLARLSTRLGQKLWMLGDRLWR